MNPKPRLNLFALPSQTTLVFAGILIIIGLPLLFSLAGRFVVLMPLLPLVVLLFTVWDFLAEPVRVKRRYKAQTMTGDDGVWLTRWMDKLCRQIGLQPPILLQTAERLDMPFAFGTWRQHYVIFPEWLIEKLHRESLADTERAQAAAVLLHHELAHFANHDVVLTGFARSLLRQTIFVTLAYWAALMWIPIIYQVGVRYLPTVSADIPAETLALLPPEWQTQIQEIVNNPPQLTWVMMVITWLELSMAVLPLVGGAVFLWLRDLSLLLRVRELYADARVDGWLGGIAPRLARMQSWLHMGRLAAQQAQAQNAAGKGRWRLPEMHLAQNLTLSWPLSWSLPWPDRAAGSILRPHPQPKDERRKSVLARPHEAYGTVAETGRRAGVIVLLLFLIMASLLAPAQKGIGSEIGIGLGFLVLATGLTPRAIAQLPDLQAIRSDRHRAIGFYMLVFNSVLLVALAFTFIGVLLRPDDLNLAMYAIAGVLPPSVQPVIEDPLWYVVQVMIGTLLVYFVAAPLLLYGFLSLDFRLKRRVLHWYGASWLPQRSVQVLLLISGGLTVVLWLGVAPLLHLIAFPGILSVDWFPAVGVAVALLCAAALVWWLRRGDRLYSNRCPHCGSSIETDFHLGLSCPQCGERLQPWLAARD